MTFRVSDKANRFTESIIREMSRVCRQHNAVNLAQGFPDFPAPPALKDAAAAAIAKDINQYAITWGSKRLRDAVAAKAAAFNGLAADPETMITICCGATECMIAAMLALLNPGDEVVIFEPFYENYGPDTILTGCLPRYVPLRAQSSDGAPTWSFDPQELAAAFGPRTRGIVVNTPHNPLGKVFTRPELEVIRDLCVRHDALCFTDEIYEHILYDGRTHLSPAAVPGMADRTITISGLSKTFSVTGWRLGYAIAIPPYTDAIRKVHDFLTVGAPAPLQEAGAVALGFDRSYYNQVAREYQARRDYLVGALEAVGFDCVTPEGAYYIMADFRRFGFSNDTEFSMFLAKEVGVAGVPGSSFFAAGNPAGKAYIRFCFPKTQATLEQAVERLQALPAKARAAARTNVLSK